MALTNTTNWITANNNQTKELDLLEATHIESARIKFRGNEKEIKNTNIDNIETTYPNEPPEGFQEHRYIAAVTIKNESDYAGHAQIIWRYNLNKSIFEGSETISLDSGESKTFTKTYVSTDNWVGDKASLEAGPIIEPQQIEVGIVFSEIRLETFITENSVDPQVKINNSQLIYHSGTLSRFNSTDWYDITALEANQINKLFFQVSGSGKINYEIEYTYQPKLLAPERIAPENDIVQTNRDMIFELKLTEDEESDTELYHAKIAISKNSDMGNIELEFESINSQENWELLENGDWIPFPKEGVAPGSTVKLKVNDFNYGIYYWQASMLDNYGYGYATTIWKYRISIATKALYFLDIEGQEYNAYQLSVIEASNGEIGGIDFSLNNQDGSTFETVKTGDTVLLAVNDNLGNKEEFQAKIRNRQPSGNELQTSAITGDGILADRRVKQDYASQDIGISVKDIIDNYCSPLTSVNVNTETGIIAPIKSTDKTPLSVLEKLRRKYGLHYYVDKDWDMHFYLSDTIEDGALTIRRGD